MKKIILPLIFLIAPIIFTGCLVGHSLSYNVELDSPNSGTATIIYKDIRSDAKTEAELEKDKKNLFDFMLTSDLFVKEMAKEGKKIVSRELYKEDGKLNGKVVFKFDKLENFERRMKYDDGFFFLTLELDDEIVSTNGLVIKSENYKRIIWDGFERKLKFTILTEPSKDTSTKDLAQFYK